MAIHDPRKEPKVGDIFHIGGLVGALEILDINSDRSLKVGTTNGVDGGSYWIIPKEFVLMTDESAILALEGQPLTAEENRVLNGVEETTTLDDEAIQWIEDAARTGVRECLGTFWAEGVPLVRKLRAAKHELARLDGKALQWVRKAVNLQRRPGGRQAIRPRHVDYRRPRGTARRRPRILAH